MMKKRLEERGDCSRGSTAWAVGLCLLAVGALFVGASPALAQSSDNACIKTEIGGNPPCTAGDVRVGRLDVVGDPVTCEPGTDVTVTLQATIESGPERWAIGLWVNQDGGSALDDPVDNCYRDYLHPVDSSVGNDGCSQDNGGPYYDGDDDSCGDVYAQNTTPCGDNEDIIAPCTGGGGTCLFTFYTFTTTIKCENTNPDMDATADVGTCTSWDNQVVGTCMDERGTNPGTGSKCACGRVEVFGLFTGCMTNDDCDDGIACTDDVCTIEGSTGTCSNTPNDGLCAGDQCNAGVCDPDFDCQLVPLADSTPCEDGDACTSETGTPQTPDHCEAGQCVGVPVGCGPGDECNDNECNSATGACEFVPKADSTPCEDGNACTSETGTPQTPDHCEAGQCVGVPVGCGPGDECNDNECNPATGACEFVPKADSSPCEDGDACTSETGTPQTPDHCEAGQCVGVPVGCGPGDECNDNECNSATGACEFVPKADSSPCEDGDACTSETGTPQTPDHCEAGECVGVPVTCGPGDQCNDDVCDPATGTCEFVPKEDSTRCSDGDACTSETGDEASADHCVAGQCVGVPVVCGPGDQCNDDVCDKWTGRCEFEPKADSTHCEDGDACTSETGDEASPDHCESGQCVGVPVVCGPGDQCNDDVCDPTTGTCEFEPKAESTPCDDPFFCTSFGGVPGDRDHCDGMGSCVGDPVDCNDGFVCTEDTCNEGTDQCDNDWICNQPSISITYLGLMFDSTTMLSGDWGISNESEEPGVEVVVSELDVLVEVRFGSKGPWREVAATCTLNPDAPVAVPEDDYNDSTAELEGTYMCTLDGDPLEPKDGVRVTLEVSILDRAKVFKYRTTMTY